MAWETVVLKVPEPTRHNKLRHPFGLCPKCTGRLFTIPLPLLSESKAIPLFFDDEMEYLVLVCDRCGQFMAFEGCHGDCAACRKSKCEICGRFYCGHCGISEDIEIDEKRVELRYCNDHIPDWYRNR